jgi:hypothetical protein
MASPNAEIVPGAFVPPGIFTAEFNPVIFFRVSLVLIFGSLDDGLRKSEEMVPDWCCGKVYCTGSGSNLAWKAARVAAF